LVVTDCGEVELNIIENPLKAQDPKITLPNGQYILQISDENGVYRKQLIIRH
jgi:hypothetical protein